MHKQRWGERIKLSSIDVRPSEHLFLLSEAVKNIKESEAAWATTLKLDVGKARQLNQGLSRGPISQVASLNLLTRWWHKEITAEGAALW